MTAQTLYDKLWNSHVVRQEADGTALLYIDRHLVHEVTSPQAFEGLKLAGRKLWRVDSVVSTADHNTPTDHWDEGIKDPISRQQVETLDANIKAFGALAYFPFKDKGQGIVHVMGPEQGATLPGMTVVCGDSHTSTHGALGAIGFGIGASEVAHVLMTQTLWQKRPRLLRVTVTGRLGPGIAAKDMALAVIARLGADGGRGHAIEYAGDAVRALSMEGRMTLCNLSIECGARCGMVAPDETTFSYLRGRAHAPVAFEQACDHWRTLPTDETAIFDREVSLDAADIVPTVTWGTSPEDALPITASIPDPARMEDPARAAHVREALDYMGLRAGQALTEVAVDRVFVGSCTNSRIEDLRLAAAVLAGRCAVVPGLVSPGSVPIRQRAEQEGLDRVFVAAGLEWGEPGCSMCVGMNGDIVPPGQRCASTTNRNFRGRQGPGARTHLMSPAMAAAAAVTGFLTDARPMLAGRA